MKAFTDQGQGWIWLSIISALLLSIIALPDALDPWITRLRPDWLALVLIYWSLALPHRYSLFSAWLAGLMLDVLTGSLLGQHALSLTVMIYLVQRMHLQVRVYPLWQQSLLIAGLLAIYHFFLFWIDGATDSGELSHWRWLPIISSALIWPIVNRLLLSLRLRLME